MGLISAITQAAQSALADSWREYFYCDSIPVDVLITKANKRQNRNSSNTKGSDNVISNGSIIAVADGQCMLIVEQGKVVEVCAEPGEFVWDSSTEPSIFYGSLGENIKKSFAQIGKRFTFGGDTAKDQRVYYVNTKEILGNKYGTPNPVPFRVVDKNIGLDVDIAIRCHGEYSYRVTDPVLFYTNVASNVTSEYRRSQIDSQLKSELMTSLQPVFARISEMGIRYSALPAHTKEIADVLNDEMSDTWSGLRGISVISFGVSSVTASEEDEKMIKELQKNAVLTNPAMAAATLTAAQAEAMKAAASIQAGAMTGFMGMGMASQAGGANMQSLYQMGAQQQAQAAPKMQPSSGVGTWKCECGAENTGKFCSECGKPKPQPAEWTCSCGTVNTGKFCSECGSPRPAGKWICSCGAENTGKFCAECGKPRP